MTDIELIQWDCPECEETNQDIPNQLTHCGACGHVVWVGDEDGMIDDQHWSVPVDRSTREAAQ